MHILKRLAIPIGAMAGLGGLAALGFVVARRRRVQVSPVIASVTINRSPEEVYAFFRNFEQLPCFMDYLESVDELGQGLSRWTARLPGGRTVSWEAELTEDRPGNLIAWQSVEGSSIQVRGRVLFTKAPGRDATEVRVELELGVVRIGPKRSLARWFARPQVKGDLSRLKMVLETGEVLMSDVTVHRRPRPARPPERGTVVLGPELIAEVPPTAQPMTGQETSGQKGVTP